MSESTDNRVVVITGAGSGIGRATARRFAGAGARVLAIGRRMAPLIETADGYRTIKPLAADVTGAGEPERIVATAVEAFGRLDVLVNNAALAVGGALEDARPELIDPLLATNLVAPILLAKAALPALSSGGVIVNVSTSVGQRAWPGNGVYAATKTALELLTRTWAVELAPRGIRVVAVAPGAIQTPIADHLPLERLAELRRWQLQHTPLGRLGTPEEVAWAITQLASPSASFVTGTVIAVDGGAVVA